MLRKDGLTPKQGSAQLYFHHTTSVLHGTGWRRTAGDMVIDGVPKVHNNKKACIVMKWNLLSMDSFSTSAETHWTPVNGNLSWRCQLCLLPLFLFGKWQFANRLHAYCIGLCTCTSMLEHRTKCRGRKWDAVVLRHSTKQLCLTWKQPRRLFGLCWLDLSFRMLLVYSRCFRRSLMDKDVCYQCSGAFVTEVHG